MAATTKIASIDEFQQHEPNILAAINAAPHGAELFLADPFRFLSEHGFVIPRAVEAQLKTRAPALAKAPTQLYDRIAAGGASLVGDASDDITWHIRSLGVTS